MFNVYSDDYIDPDDDRKRLTSLLSSSYMSGVLCYIVSAFSQFPNCIKKQPELIRGVKGTEFS